MIGRGGVAGVEGAVDAAVDVEVPVVVGVPVDVEATVAVAVGAEALALVKGSWKVPSVHPPVHHWKRRRRMRQRSDRRGQGGRATSRRASTVGGVAGGVEPPVAASGDPMWSETELFHLRLPSDLVQSIITHGHIVAFCNAFRHHPSLSAPPRSRAGSHRVHRVRPAQLAARPGASRGARAPPPPPATP